jgi:hypothetical protein
MSADLPDLPDPSELRALAEQAILDLEACEPRLPACPNGPTDYGMFLSEMDRLALARSVRASRQHAREETLARFVLAILDRADDWEDVKDGVVDAWAEARRKP